MFKMEQHSKHSILKKAEFDGIEMGVMADGTSFLTGRGLARLCGVSPSAILTWGPGWSPTSVNERDRILTRLLGNHGYYADSLFIRCVHEHNEITAYPEAVCYVTVTEDDLITTEQMGATPENLTADQCTSLTFS